MKPKYILYDAVFEKKFERYRSQLTDIEKNRLRNKLKAFKEDIFDRRLKTHKLKGNLSDYYAFSINYSHRIVFKLLKDGSVYFIEVGSHDVCY